MMSTARGVPCEMFLCLYTMTFLREHRALVVSSMAVKSFFRQFHRVQNFKNAVRDSLKMQTYSCYAILSSMKNMP